MQPFHVRFPFWAVITLLAWQPCHAEEAFSNAQSGWDQTENETETAFTKHYDSQSKAWEDIHQRVLRKWSDGALPEKKIFVEYFNGDSTRLKVDYENGAVTVETLIDKQGSANSAKIAKDSISKALSEIVSPARSSAEAVLSIDEISNSQESMQALATSLSKSTATAGTELGGDGQERQLFRVTFKLVPDYIKRRAAKYKPTVDVWAKKYNLDPAFILGIMRQESAFNPRARSSAGAVGLLQIMPQFAGQEVMGVVTGKAAPPTPEYLYDPSKNIMVGSTYLQLLRDKYFQSISDKATQQYLITCAYNWGPHRIKTAISKGRLKTRMPASDIFNRLQEIAPSETREYLRKVTQYTKDFKGKD